MPRIPDWTALGTATPQPSYRRPFIDEAGREIAGALEGAGHEFTETGDEMYAHNVNFARAQASNALLDNEIAVRDQTENIRQQVASGQLPWDQAAKAFDNWSANQQPPAIPNLDSIGQESLERGITRNIAGGQQAVYGIVRGGQRQAFQDQFDAAQEKLGRLAGMPNADVNAINSQMDAYRPMALEAGIAAPEVDKAIDAFKERNWLNQATQRAMEAKDDPTGLEQLRHDLVDQNGLYQGKLDVDKRDIVLRSVINDQLILQNRAEHEADKREAKAQATIGRIDEQIASGIPATPDMWNQWEGLTKGTNFEQDFRDRLQDEQTVQGVLREPIDQQVKYVQDRAAQLESQGGTLRDRANLLRLQTAVNQNVNLLEHAPLVFNANRTGTELQPLAFDQLSTDQGKQQFQQQIADRMATLRAMRTQYGPSVTPTPLLPEEASALGRQLQEQTPGQRAQLLVTLRGAMNDDTAYQNAMRQIAPHSPVTAIAGSLVGSSAPAATPIWFDQRYAPSLDDARTVLHGEALLNPAAGGKEAQAEQDAGKGGKSAFPMPPETGPTGTRQLFARASADLFRSRPELGEAYYQAFRDAYAGLLADKGDIRGVGDPRLEQQALKIALGSTVEFNGSTVSIPRGMDPSSFRGLLENAVAASAQNAKVPENWLSSISGYQLLEDGALGSGRYFLTDGNRYVTYPGRATPFVVDLRDQYLAARGAHRGTPDFRAPADGSGQPIPNRMPAAQ